MRTIVPFLRKLMGFRSTDVHFTGHMLDAMFTVYKAFQYKTTPTCALLLNSYILILELNKKRTLDCFLSFLKCSVSTTLTSLSEQAANQAPVLAQPAAAYWLQIFRTVKTAKGIQNQ